MELSNKSGQSFYMIAGLLFLLISGLFSTVALSTGNFPVGHELIIFGIGIMCFCLSYLYPQFIKNDERTKKIKERGMYYSYFFIMIYMIAMMGLYQFDVINLNGYQTVSLLAALTIITVFLSFVVLSKRY